MSAGGAFGGGRSQYHLRQVGVFLDLHFINKPELFVQAFQPPQKFDSEGNLIDPETKERVKNLLLSLYAFTLRLKNTCWFAKMSFVWQILSNCNNVQQFVVTLGLCMDHACHGLERLLFILVWWCFRFLKFFLLSKLTKISSRLRLFRFTDSNYLSSCLYYFKIILKT